MERQLIFAAVAGAIVLTRIPGIKRALGSVAYGFAWLSLCIGAPVLAVYVLVRLVHWAWTTPAW